MKDYLMQIAENKCIALNTFKMRLMLSEELPKIKAGQFLNLETGDKSQLLRRPFCIFDFGKDYVDIVYQIAGKGTAILSKKAIGEKLFATLPLGNGFDIDPKYSKIALVGGGVGAAPLHLLPKQYIDREFFAFLGFSNRERVILEKEYRFLLNEVFISTDDGSFGSKGYVTELLSENLLRLKIDCIIVGGNNNLLRAASELAIKNNIGGYVTVESRMACGVGACLVCACKQKNTEDEGFTNVRACVEGPVFEIGRTII